MGLLCIVLALYNTKLWACILLPIMVQHCKEKPCLELWTLCLFFSSSVVSHTLLLKLLNFTVLPRQNSKWDPALILSPVFLDGASQLKFSNFKNSSLRLWLVNGYEPCLLLFLQESPPILLQSDILLTSKDMPMTFCSNVTLFLVEVVLPNHQNKVYRQLLSSCGQRVHDFHPSPWFLQCKEKEGFLECICNHYLQFRHAWKQSLRILHSQAQSSACIYPETPVFQLY